MKQIEKQAQTQYNWMVHKSGEPAHHHGMLLKPPKIMGFQLPTSTGELTGFLPWTVPSLKLTACTWKWTPGKGDSYWKPPFLGAMLVLPGFWTISSTHRIHGTGIFTYIWLIFMVNVAKHTIHRSYGVCQRTPWTFHFGTKQSYRKDFQDSQGAKFGGEETC